jgi:4-carboxymuconolactone decarboxylase
MDAFEKNRDLIEQFCPGATQWGQLNFSPIFPDLVEKIISDIYGFAYRRPSLDLRTRHLISLGAISAMGGCENQLDFQLRSALHLGLTPDEVREVFIQVSVFAGNARAINAAGVFKAILDEMQNSEKTNSPCA